MVDLTLSGTKNEPVSAWLVDWANGKQRAADDIQRVLGPYLLRAAKIVLKRHDFATGLSAKELVYEGWLRLGVSQRAKFKNRRHFFGTVVRAMNFVLIDHHRSERNSHAELPDRREPDLLTPEYIDFLNAMQALQERFPRQALHLMLLHFVDLTLEETADISGYALITVRRDVRFAASWIKARVLAQS